MWSVLVVVFCVIGSVKANNLDCRLPKHSGVCQARDPRFYFDVYSKQCRKFIYGGCGGNANNFKTLNECQEKCMVKRKPGICAPPIIVPGQIDTICVEECNRDDDCQVKPGFCPPVPTDSSGVCVDECSSDDTCPGEQKCCSNGCGHFCSVTISGVIPRPVKPGFCPPVPTDSAGVCVDECSSDDTCQGEKKCCSNGCGHFCSMVTGGVMPLPAPCRIGKPLPHIFCGRGPYRQKCPKGYYCNNDRGDRFAVCCQRSYS
ncbi:WFDC3 [Mytilus edulis]|uniref:WFDC3 n=1 Tax=Mytilus edulis TaxID=6550 RepID=A0A8S3R111_MYTED|nr:WFDC3 [Mytilus edulis]